jgi:hypothetical protein
MPFRTDLTEAAGRHWRDAESLRTSGADDSAGYHYGFAAECALKAAVRADPDNDHTVRKHLSTTPQKDLRPVIRLRLTGRHHQILRRLLAMQNYFADWDVSMRYAPNGSIDPAKCELWRNHSLRTLRASGIAI